MLCDFLFELARKDNKNSNWGPLTYNFLDHPIFNNLKYETFNPFNLRTPKPQLDLSTINNGVESNGAPNKLETSLDTMVCGRAKAEGVKARNADLLANGADQIENLKTISAMTSFNSGKLCAGNNFCLSKV
jgi:hypothetical protein